MTAGARKGHETMREALQLRQSVANAQHVDSSAKASALASVPILIPRLIRGARGLIRSWPASAQLEAMKMTFGIAGIALEAHGNGSGPLSEMSLHELAESLAESLESARNLIALEGTASQVPDSNTLECPNQGNSEAEQATPSEEADATPASSPTQEADDTTPPIDPAGGG